MSDQKKPKIYAFANAERDPVLRGYPVVAIAEDGHVLGGHFCSSMAFAQHDLHDRPDRKAACEAHYPDGYEFVALPEGTFPPDEVFERNEMRAKQP
jgi:hypothetical protein